LFRHAQIAVSIVSILTALLLFVATPAHAEGDLLDLGGIVNSMSALLGATPDGQRAPAPSTQTRLGAKTAAKSAQQAIIDAFGSKNGQRAVKVGKCESKLDATARNGNHMGLFQMGPWARRTFGHGPDAESQAQAAYRYFQAAGWAPWSHSQGCWQK